MRGEVKNPGEISCPTPTPVSSILTFAGGYTQYAYRKRVEIHRDRTTIILNPLGIPEVEKQRALVRAGDVVIVPRVFCP